MFPIEDTVPRRHPPVVVWTLIVVNAVVFWYQISLTPEQAQALAYQWALVPRRFSDPAWALAHGLDPYNYLPFFTNMFMHGGWGHIIGNMWVLWVLGSAVEDRFGRGRFLIFYVLCGLAASFTHYLFNVASEIPALGASGAIAGVIAAYGIMFPRARVIFVIPIFFFPFFFDLPALVFALIWYLMQVFPGVLGLMRPEMGGGIAWWAHIGGFVAGAVLLALFRPRLRRRRYFRDETRLGYGTRGEKD